MSAFISKRRGSGTPIIFLHEFAADHTNWEPQMRYFSRGHRCIAYSARGYTPSDVPPTADVYTYKHFYTDALAVLDHLDIAKAHFIGLSMGSYSSLQVGLNAPERALSMTLAAVGSGSSLENLDAFRRQCQANAEQYEKIGSVEVAKATREAPSRIPFCSRTRAVTPISTPRWRGMMPRARPTPCAAFKAAGPRSTP
jgi:3-oxoadipate enol-lactonase